MAHKFSAIHPLFTPAPPMSHLEVLQSALADHYRLERELGVGGMASVYLAHDRKHDRPVAIKVLKPELGAALGAERFLAEIRVTANLQHPNLLPLFDSGEAEGLLYYVMPYVEGETLRERLTRDRQLPVDEAVRLASAVGRALAYAHDRGVIHRDLKPENILLHAGQPIVLDFGIALAMRNAAARLTQTGVSIGTPQYMSPEQAAGEKHIDARADIYALGAVLYEMLVGEAPHTGPSTQAILAKVMTEDVRPVTMGRPSAPANVAVTVHKALARIPADRFETADDFVRALHADWTTPVTTSGARHAAPRGWRGLLTLPGLLAIAAAITASAAVTWALVGRPVAPPPVARAVLMLAGNELLATVFDPIDISRDGRFVAYVGEVDGRTHLFVRALADTIAHALPGTEGSDVPFFSPDGEWIGFFAHQKLRKVPRAGGEPIEIADASNVAFGASWGDDGNIVFSMGGTSLLRVSANGGTATPITVRMPHGAGTSRILRDPSLLPGDARALVTTDSGVGVVDLGSGDVSSFVVRGGQASYLPTKQLVYDGGDGRIRVAPFDLKRGAVTGASLPAFESFRGPGGGAAYYAVSRTGVLVYARGGYQRALVRVDRNGRQSVLTRDLRGYRFPRVSPDGKHVAVTIDPRPSSVWIVDVGNGFMSPLTTLGRHTLAYLWSSDGRRVGYSDMAGISSLAWEGGQPPSVVLPVLPTLPAFTLSPRSWLPDGTIVGMRWSQRLIQGTRDVVRFTIGDTVIQPIVATPANEDNPLVSHDGRWLAYSSDVTGSSEVYVRPLDGGTTTRVSPDGGGEPAWSRAGDELFYRRGVEIMGIKVRTGLTFEVLGSPQPLFSGPFDFTQMKNWDVTPDGNFIMVRGDVTAGSHLRVVFNWSTELASMARQ